eukprot:CAMPEP_0182448910 /NCGR_PEP_ID=MMETSP1172-20130603/30606_1 /TAXON_ID=708627 /ORGANISM="Timspurckia oligopyrenoides, Strain CCMP3278" /LENGTH=644 /DNA_ID=CAMNT_0024645955 /DNA_START=119 /DNA_END=2053 /DNA_ORIENTATION=+
MDVGYHVPRNRISNLYHKHLQILQQNQSQALTSNLPQLHHSIRSHILLAISQLYTTWLDSCTLPQTLFSSIWLYNIDQLSATEPLIFSFGRLLLSCTSRSAEVIVRGAVFDEEDFVPWTFGFDKLLESESPLYLRGLVKSALKSCTDPLEVSLLGLFLHWYCILMALETPNRSVSSIFALTPALEQGQKLVNRVEQLLRSKNSDEILDDVEFIWKLPGFDQTMNKHCLQSSPPRTNKMHSIAQSLTRCSKLLSELTALVDLPNQLKGVAVRSLDSSKNEQISKHSTSSTFAFEDCVFLFSLFSCTHVPHILIRSILKSVLSVQGILGFDVTVEDLLKAEYEVSGTIVLRVSREANNLLASFCRNRGRQRRKMVHLARSIFTCAVALSESASNKTVRQNALVFLSSISFFTLEYHFLLGFETELYSDSEYEAVYYNLWKLLSLHIKQRILKINSNRDTKTTSDEFHFNRLLMYKEICEALYICLCALNNAGVMNRRQFPFGGIESWYGLRFDSIEKYLVREGLLTGNIDSSLSCSAYLMENESQKREKGYALDSDERRSEKTQLLNRLEEVHGKLMLAQSIGMNLKRMSSSQLVLDDMQRCIQCCTENLAQVESIQEFLKNESKQNLKIITALDIHQHFISIRIA